MPYRSQTLTNIAAKIEKLYPDEAIKLRNMSSGLYKQELENIDIILKWNKAKKQYDIISNSSLGNTIWSIYEFPRSIPKNNLKSTVQSLKKLYLVPLIIKL